jgi:hypothetical protein
MSERPAPMIRPQISLCVFPTPFQVKMPADTGLFWQVLSADIKAIAVISDSCKEKFIMHFVYYAKFNSLSLIARVASCD